MSGSIARWILLLTFAPVLVAQTATLPFAVDYAQYSKATDRLIIGNFSDAILHLYDPVTSTDTQITLPGKISDLAVNRDGTYAVASGMQVYWIDLRTQRVVNSLTYPKLNGFYVGGFHLVMAGRFAYTQDGAGYMYVSSPDSAAITAVGLRADFTTFISDQEESALYTYRVKYKIGPSGGLQAQNGPVRAGCETGRAAVGTSIIFNCGEIMQTSSVTSADFLYRGRFSLELDSVSVSSSRNELAAIQAIFSANSSTPVDQTRVMLFSWPGRQYRGKIQMPAGMRPRYVFYSTDGSHLHVVSSGASWRVHSYNLSQPCTSGVVDATTLSIPASGGFGETGITTAEGCVWNATVLEGNWLRLVENAVAGPAAKLAWYSPANPSPQPRSCRVSVAGQTITVTQAGQLTGGVNPAVLPFPTSVDDSTPFDHSFDMSRSTGLLYGISRRPDQLHGFDRATLTEKFTLDLPGVPTAMSLSPDGNYAAVAFDALVGRVDLAKGAFDRFCVVSENPAWIAHNSVNILVPSGSCDIATGVFTESKINGDTARIATDGRHLITTGPSFMKWRVDGATPAYIRSAPIGFGGAIAGLTSDRMFTSVGQVFAVSDNPSLDMTLIGQLPAMQGPRILPLLSRQLLLSTVGGDAAQVTRADSVTYAEQPKVAVPSLTPPGSAASTLPLGIYGTADESEAIAAFSNYNSAYSGRLGPTVVSLYRLPASALTRDTSPCVAVFSTTRASIWQNGQGLSVFVDIPVGCTWRISLSDPWLRVSVASGTGPGSFILSADMNTGADRKGTLRAGDSTIEISQLGQSSCVYNLDTRALHVPSQGGWYTLDVRTQPGCFFQIGGPLTAIVVEAGNPRRIGVVANPGPERTFMVTFAGVPVTITQDGAATTSCTMTLFNEPFHANGERGTVTPVFKGTCPSTWKITNQPPWLQLFPLEGSTANPGTLSYTAYPNYSNRIRGSVVQMAGVADTMVYQNLVYRTDDEQFVAYTYFAFFGRHPSDAEVAFQVNEGLHKGLSRADLWSNFTNSEEFNRGGRFVAGLYVGLLTRDAEFGGWLFQRNALATGQATTTQLTANFLNSAEWGLRFGSVSDTDFVRFLYRNVLLREGSQAEVDAQVAALQNGSRTNMASAFLNSAEFRIGTGPRLTAFLLYATIFGRDPAATELASRQARLAAGVPARSLAEELLSSGVFSAAIN